MKEPETERTRESRRPRQTGRSSGVLEKMELGSMDFVLRLPPKLTLKILSFVDLRNKFRLLRVSRTWKKIATESIIAEQSSTWLYVIFRKTHIIGDSRVIVRVSYHGPIFWEKQIIYFNCCYCHFSSRHLNTLLQFCRLLCHRIQRICLVDSPVHAPFLPDCFFDFITRRLTNLEFLYVREVDLRYLNFRTVLQMAVHPKLKKVVVHNCTHYDVVQDFNRLPQVMVCNQKSVCKALVEEYDEMDVSERVEEIKRSIGARSLTNSPKKYVSPYNSPRRFRRHHSLQRE